MFLLRPRGLMLVALVVLPAVMGGSAHATTRQPVFQGQPSVLSAAEVERLAANANNRSVVILKNQHPEAPPRVASAQRQQAEDADQAPIRGELAQLNSPDVKSFHLVNAVVATLSDAEITRLSSNPTVQAVVPDAVRRFAQPNQSGAAGAAAARGSQPTASQLQQICPQNPAVPLLEPEALQVMNVEFQVGSGQPAAHDLADGTGVKIGIVADGLDPNNPDLQRNGHRIIFDFQDFSGFGNGAPTDGREAFLDAGAIAAQGAQTYDLSGFVNPAHPLPSGCNIRIRGVAPGSSLAVMNVGGSNPTFFNSQVIQAIEWAVNVDNVDVLNESIGANPIPDTRNDPVQLANEAAVRGGVVVVTSTGDAGSTNTIGSPATSSDVIAVGGSTTYQIYRQTTRYDTQLVPGSWLSDNISALSSGGSSEFGARGPDVVAPADRGWALCSTDASRFFGCADIDHGSNPPPIWAAGGTSLASPLTSGTAALVIQAYASTHNGAKPTPDVVKRIIVSTADDLGAPADHQGAGLVNSLKAVQLAESISPRRGSTPLGTTLLVDRPNLIATAQAGALQSFPVQVTNESAIQQTLTPALVDLNGDPVSKDSGTVRLSSADQTLIDGEGNTDFFVEHQFTVPPEVDYLNGDIVWDAENTPGAAFETLFDPLGRVAAYSLLGANASGRGHVEVRQPTAGTWIAVIFTVNNGLAYSGDVHFSFSTLRFEDGGSVSPNRVSLGPGQSVTLNVSPNAIDSPGDHVGTLRLATGGTNDGSLPVVVRTLVPLTAHSGGSFSGVFTGGADQLNAGQRVTYQFDVPDSEPSLNIAVRLRDPNYDVQGYLIDPHGEALDVQSTTLFDASDAPIGWGPNLQFFHRTPTAGRWTLSFVVFTAINGAHLSVPFSASVDFAAPSVTARGLPNSAARELAAGQPVTATITVKNTGTVTKEFFADARLRHKALTQLLGSGVNGVGLPLSILSQPNWLVPPGTNQLLVAAQGTVPILAEIEALTGDPDVLGVALPGNFVLAQLLAVEVAPGFIFGFPEAKGPFPSGGLAGGATVNLAAVARTNPFDPAVTADSGDVWALSVDPTAAYQPLRLGPGQSGTITLVITPTGGPGADISGYIGIDTFNPATLSGDELIRLPYEYTVR
jgi:hypothetical protein